MFIEYSAEVIRQSQLAWALENSAGFIVLDGDVHYNGFVFVIIF